MSRHGSTPEGPGLRVAQVVPSFDRGGLERCVATLASGLRPLGIETRVLSLGSERAAADWLPPDCELREVENAPGLDPAVVGRLAGALAERPPAAIHSHAWGALVESVLARRRSRVPGHVHTWHGAVPRARSRIRSAARALATRWALSRVDACVAVSESVRADHAAWCGLAPGRIRVVRNGTAPVDSGWMQAVRPEMRARLGAGERTVVIGGVGRLEPVKAFEVLIDAVARLVREEAPVALVVVGGGSQAEALRRRAAEVGIDDAVRWVGAVDDAAPWLAAMDVYVSCSRMEGLSLALLEAMAAGLPILATPVGETAAVLGDTACGALVPVDDPAALAAALRERLEPARRAREGCAARERHAERFGLAPMLEAHRAIYQEVAG